ncbi:MAG: hypothetical protein HHAS10_01650 [Candidatus Altimarinota bacterium]
MGISSCDEINSGVRTGAAMSATDNLYTSSSIDSKWNWDTIKENPILLGLYTQYKDECDRIREPGGAERSKLAFDVFLSSRLRWIKEELLSDSKFRIEENLPLGSYLQVAMRVLSLTRVNPYSPDMSQYTIPGNIGTDKNRPRGTCLEQTMIASTFLSKQKIPHYVSRGIISYTLPNGKKVVEGHAYIIVPGKTKGVHYMFDSMKNIFQELRGFDPKKNQSISITMSTGITYTYKTDSVISSQHPDDDTNYRTLSKMVLINMFGLIPSLRADARSLITTGGLMSENEWRTWIQSDMNKL